jgi:YjbE family integral membrane protein
VFALVQVVFVDLILAGDNAVVVGMAIAGLPQRQRTRAMVLGIAAATILRILFASVAVQVLQIIGLTLAGGLLLLWVCWKLWRELEEGRRERRARRQDWNSRVAEGDCETGARTPAEHESGKADRRGTGEGGHSREAPAAPAGQVKTLRQAAAQIVIADLSMSLDNVLAVAGIAREHVVVLAFGLVLSVLFMGLAAVLIARLLGRFPWIAYVGLALIFYVAVRMIVEGSGQVIQAAIVLWSA